MNTEPETQTPNSPWEDGRIILIDKPNTWTSFDVVSKIRNTIRYKKVGHAGTLDPLATGLLIVCTGKATKQIDKLIGQTKTYSGHIDLGYNTASYDLETEASERYEVSHLDASLVRSAMLEFIGNIEQLPPMYSAIKIAGKPLYLAARKGQEIERKTRPVTITSFELTSFENTNSHVRVGFEVSCSKGTYIRSLAYDLGVKLRTGGTLASLRRTCIGSFDLCDALQLPEFLEMVKAGETFENFSLAKYLLQQSRANNS